MTAATHLDSLEHKRALIKQAILEEKNRPFPDSIRLTTLKKENLKLKEEIERLTRQNVA
ncbi:MAG: YdcH family protein [Sphingomonadales bacterium]